MGQSELQNFKKWDNREKTGKLTMEMHWLCYTMIQYTNKSHLHIETFMMEAQYKLTKFY